MPISEHINQTRLKETVYSLAGMKLKWKKVQTDFNLKGTYLKAIIKKTKLKKNLFQFIWLIKTTNAIVITSLLALHTTSVILTEN